MDNGISLEKALERGFFALDPDRFEKVENCRASLDLLSYLHSSHVLDGAEGPSEGVKRDGFSAILKLVSDELGRVTDHLPYHDIDNLPQSGAD